jgi:spore germination protein GerM
MVTRLRFILVALGFGLMAAGCAVPTQNGPSTIGPNHVPFDLLNPQAQTTTTTEPPLSSLVPVKVYLLAPNQQLLAVERVVVSPAPLTSVLNAMLAGPTSSEAAKGTTTAIPNNVAVLSVATQGATVTVNFNSAFGQITGTSTEQAVSQVVATVAEQTGISTGVIFEIDGHRSSVPIASGAQVPGPVYLLQFVPVSP